MLEMLRSFWNDESGQGLAEYAVLIALITLALIVIITLFGAQILRVFSLVTSRLTSVGT